jgi:hypothetical protein
MLVGILTEQQKTEIVGQKFRPDSFFNPVLDYYGNWVISQVEIDECINPEFLWVKDLPLEPFVPGPPPGPTGQNF